MLFQFYCKNSIFLLQFLYFTSGYPASVALPCVALFYVFHFLVLFIILIYYPVLVYFLYFFFHFLFTRFLRCSLLRFCSISIFEKMKRLPFSRHLFLFFTYITKISCLDSYHKSNIFTRKLNNINVSNYKNNKMDKCFKIYKSNNNFNQC